jgi:hypothetical protein
MCYTRRIISITNLFFQNGQPYILPSSLDKVTCSSDVRIENELQICQPVKVTSTNNLIVKGAALKRKQSINQSVFGRL